MRTLIEPEIVIAIVLMAFLTLTILTAKGRDDEKEEQNGKSQEMD